MTNDPRAGWHTVKDEAELKKLVKAGYHRFTLRPNGSTMWAFMNENMLKKEIACLALPGFVELRPPSWQLFREIVTGLKYGWTCVPGPFTATELAEIEYYTNQ